MNNITPILTGKDAERFLENMNNLKPVSRIDKERMIDNYNKMMNTKVSTSKQLSEYNKMIGHIKDMVKDAKKYGEDTKPFEDLIGVVDTKMDILSGKIKQQKYYTPRLEDFHVGYQMETSYLCKEWTPFTITKENVSNFLSSYIADASPLEFRVPYLTQDNLESYGYEKLVISQMLYSMPTNRDSIRVGNQWYMLTFKPEYTEVLVTSVDPAETLGCDMGPIYRGIIYTANDINRLIEIVELNNMNVSDKIIRWDIEYAKTYLDKVGIDYRIVSIDGDSMGITDDYEPERLNLVVENRITEVTYG